MITILVKCNTAEQCWKERNILRRLLSRQNIILDDCFIPSTNKLEVNNKIIVEYLYDPLQYNYNGRMADLAIGFDTWEAAILTRRSRIAMVAAYEHPYPYILKLLNYTDNMHLLSFYTIYDLSLEFKTDEPLATTIVCRLNSGDGKYAIRLSDDEFATYTNNELYNDAIINKLYREMKL